LLIADQFSAVRQPIPGSRGFRRSVNAIMRRLVQSAMTGRPITSVSTKRTLFTLVPEFAVAALDAASFASQAKVLVSLPDETFVLEPSLIQMLYLDMLVFGYATFEVSDSTVLYSDPAQFVVSLDDDGSPRIVLQDGRDVADFVGCVPFCPNPLFYGASVPEVVPQTFLFFLSFYGRLHYELSPFRKPDLLIITHESIATEELLQRRRQIIEQAEDDYDSFIIYSHGSEEKPIIEDLSRSERASMDVARDFYETHVSILRRICGCIDKSESLPYALVSFFANLESELRRLLPEGASVSVSLPERGDQP